MKIDLDEKTTYFLNVAMCSSNYAQYLNKPDTEFSKILGILYRVYQDKLRKVSPQGVGLLIAFLSTVKEEEYEKYVDLFNDKVDKIISENSSIKEQMEEMEKLR